MALVNQAVWRGTGASFSGAAGLAASGDTGWVTLLGDMAPDAF
jgi:CTP:molybdopterin cytidylyltransferase MocA